MSVFAKKKKNVLASHDLSDEQDDEDELAEIFEGLKRRFSVIAGKEIYHDLLMINKSDLLHMKIEFPNEFAEFFKNGFIELEKTITLRLHAMDMCHKQASIWSVV